MIILDTSGVLAALDARQSQHAEAARVLREPQRRILSPFVLAELDYLISHRVGEVQARDFLEDVAAGGYELHPFTSQEVAAALRIMKRYADMPLGLADASVMALADVYGCSTFLTLDERHFRAVLNAEGRPFHLLPQDA